MTLEDWKNRCDAYRELATRLQEKLERANEVIDNIYADTNESSTMCWINKYRESKNDKRN